ncbi:MAG: small ribosomal subunit Rsm22 family protein [Roseiflexaceae bacterium]
MLELPADLRTAVERALGTAPAARWMREAQELSERYRDPRAGAPARPLASGPQQTLGYAALILPATYAQLRGAMAAAAVRIPAWQPRSMLDLGSGPGTALWAATAQWPALQILDAWEREPAFVALGRDLLREAQAPALRVARWRLHDLRQDDWGDGPTYDLVVLGHVLNELDEPARQAVVARAWRRTAGLLLIVEPGTSAAFPVVRAARDQLLGAEAYTIAPCAHDQPCPLQNDWCHFPQRLRRPEFQRRARGAPSDWEDSKFSYAALARFAPGQPVWGRVIREPASNKAYAEALISAETGIVTYRALKRHRELFRKAHDLAWGDALEQAPEEP